MCQTPWVAMTSSNQDGKTSVMAKERGEGDVAVIDWVEKWIKSLREGFIELDNLKKCAKSTWLTYTLRS